jgi:hypothetical protein
MMTMMALLSSMSLTYIYGVLNTYNVLDVYHVLDVYDVLDGAFISIDGSKFIMSMKSVTLVCVRKALKSIGRLQCSRRTRRYYSDII